MLKSRVSTLANFANLADSSFCRDFRVKSLLLPFLLYPLVMATVVMAAVGVIVYHVLECHWS